MSGRSYCLFLFIAFMAVQTGQLEAYDDSISRESVKGITRLTVQISGIGDDEKLDGLSQSMLQTDVELKLRQTGLQVFSMPDSAQLPRLLVSANVMRLRAIEAYAYSLTVSLEQWVFLARDSKVLTLAVTWSCDIVGTTGRAKLSESIRGSVGDCTDKFINAYLERNPPKGQRGN